MFADFRRALVYCLHCWPFLLGMTALLMVLERVMPGSTSNAATILHGLLLFYFLQYFLNGADYLTLAGGRALKAEGAGRPKMLAFLITYGVLCLWPLTLVVILAAYGVVIEVTIGVMLLCIIGGFAVFGTLLSHRVANDPAYRLRAGVAVTGRVTMKILSRPVLFAFCAIVAVIGLSVLETLFAPGVQEVTGWIVQIFSTLASFLVTALLAVILCDAYREITAQAASPAPAV